MKLTLILAPAFTTVIIAGCATHALPIPSQAAEVSELAARSAMELDKADLHVTENAHLSRRNLCLGCVFSSSKTLDQTAEKLQLEMGKLASPLSEEPARLTEADVERIKVERAAKKAERAKRASKAKGPWRWRLWRPWRRTRPPVNRRGDFAEIYGKWYATVDKKKLESIKNLREVKKALQAADALIAGQAAIANALKTAQRRSRDPWIPGHLTWDSALDHMGRGSMTRVPENTVAIGRIEVAGPNKGKRYHEFLLDGQIYHEIEEEAGLWDKIPAMSGYMTEYKHAERTLDAHDKERSQHVAELGPFKSKLL